MTVMNQLDLQGPKRPNAPGPVHYADLHLELVRYHSDMLRLLTERVAGAQPLGMPLAPEPAAPAPHDAPEASSPASWEAALALLQSRDWTQEPVVALWLQHRYVLGLHVVLAVGVTRQGHRRLLGLLESAPEDVDCMAAFLHDLQARGVSATTGLLCTVPSVGALRRAALAVWGSDVALQRCLRTKSMEVISLLEQDEARRIRHRLRVAWMLEDAQEAATALQHVATHLDRVNRSAARQLREGLSETLTLQRTGRLLTVDRGLRVLHTPNALARRLPRQVPAGPVHQRFARLAAGLLELESTLRRVACSAYLPDLQQSLINLTRTHGHTH